jgi:FMN phosphatase YigB (HAD superfamily)
MTRMVWTADFRSLPRVLERASSGVRVIGFDVFDTLLRRRVEPETIKDLVAQELADRLARSGLETDWRTLRQRRRELEHELGCASEAAGLDHEFRLRDLAERWLAAAADDTFSIALTPEELVAYELRLERAAVFPTPGIRTLLEDLAAAGRRLVFATDIYLELDDVWELLRSQGLAHCFQAGYSSSTEMLTKRSGRLFERILEREKLTAHELLFVGDNPYSDRDAPRRLGIRTLLVRDAEEQRRRVRLRLAEQLAARDRFFAGNLAREIVETGATRLAARQDTHYHLGRLLAPAFVTFTLHVIEYARKQGLQRLLFLSREGLTFLRMYRRLVRVLGLSGQAPPAAYLGVSRAATFLPSMQRLDWAEIERMWRQYDRQSLRRLLRNLCLPEEEFLPRAARCGWDRPDEPVEDPHAHTGLRAFLADGQVQGRFLAHRDAARALLLDYLRAKGFFTCRRIGLVDIGWKGSIQDNLVRAAREAAGCPSVHGIYFGLVRSAGDSQNNHKHGFFADSARGDWIEQAIFKNGSVFEMFASARHGAVVGYRRTGGAAGRARPVVRIDDHERRNIATHFAPVLRGVEDYFRQFLDVAPLIRAAADDLRPYVLDQLRRYILYPTLAEARAFLKYSHVESFGVFGVSTYEFKGSWRSLLLGGSPLGIPRRLLAALQRQFWAEAVLRRSRLPLVNFLYDLLETRYAARVLPQVQERARSEPRP